MIRNQEVLSEEILRRHGRLQSKCFPSAVWGGTVFAGYAAGRESWELFFLSPFVAIALFFALGAFLYYTTRFALWMVRAGVYREA